MDGVILGRIGAPRGLRGEVRVQSYTRPPESILDFPCWWLETAAGSCEWALTGSRVQPNGLFVTLRDCPDRESAAALRGATISVARSSLPPPAPGEYYWHDLEGARVETIAGEVLGRVDHWLETGANDVLVVHGERERLIPWDPAAVIQQVDVAAGRIVVDWDPAF